MVTWYNADGEPVAGLNVTEKDDEEIENLIPLLKQKLVAQDASKEGWDIKLSHVEVDEIMQVPGV